MEMHTANDNGIKILGAVILRLTGNSTNGKNVQTRQITYVTDESDKLFISREACVKLGIIPSSFPTIGEAFKPDSCSNVDENLIPGSRSPLADSTQTNCECPRRQFTTCKTFQVTVPRYREQPRKPPKLAAL